MSGYVPTYLETRRCYEDQLSQSGNLDFARVRPDLGCLRIISAFQIMLRTILFIGAASAYATATWTGSAVQEVHQGLGGCTFNYGYGMEWTSAWKMSPSQMCRTSIGELSGLVQYHRVDTCTNMNGEEVRGLSELAHNPPGAL